MDTIKTSVKLPARLALLECIVTTQRVYCLSHARIKLSALEETLMIPLAVQALTSVPIQISVCNA